MRILLLAPQPFYQERGTPIAVRMLAKTLCEAGHHVDLLTFHLGEDVAIAGLRIFRIPRLWFIRRIPIGFSMAKLLCDLCLFFSLLRRLAREQYDVVHAGEESVFLALATRFLHRACVVYDMDSSMPDQLREKWIGLRFLSYPLDALERLALKRADVVVPVCQQLVDRACQVKAPEQVVLLEDFALAVDDNSGQPVDRLRQLLSVSGLLALYVGNLEPYQGLDLLLAGFARVDPQCDLSLVLIGGSPADLADYQAKASSLGISQRVYFLGPRPVSQLNDYLSQADILVSPRLKGVNTPMKIFSYLDSGRPIIATDISSHTQVLDPGCALLVDPTPDALAQGFNQLAADQSLRQTLGQAGQSLARTRFSFSRFQATVNELYGESGPLPG
ncbi:MAG: glycosyltransferase family 4 protein [Arenicellales bacterium]|nr:glycosyltransferase family 4 protein [Arenicellales bacterium]MDP6790607.1 glycosyltransferase family 4 protein [Arenicellales bacterium]MDP6919215.1 glycosyltransferase family 4 protein [Arenicellales bacterium]